MKAEKSINILGVPVGSYTMDTLLDRIETLIAAPGCAVAHGVNAHVINLTYRYPEFLKALRQADLLIRRRRLPDPGLPLFGRPSAGKADYHRHLAPVVRTAVGHGYRFFLLGGEPGLAERAASLAQRRYPGLNLVGAHHGYFDFRDSG